MRKRKKKEELKGSIFSGVLFIGDVQGFAGSPVLELDPATGQTVDCTPKDPLNPFNTLERSLALVGDTAVNLEILPHVTGRGVLINTHLQAGTYTVKPKKKNGEVVGYTITIKK